MVFAGDDGGRSVGHTGDVTRDADCAEIGFIFARRATTRLVARLPAAPPLT